MVRLDPWGGRGEPAVFWKNDGEEGTLPEEVPVREGHLFTGWNTKKKGGGTWYAPGDTCAPVQSLTTLYARWRWGIAGPEDAAFPFAPPQGRRGG